VKCLETPRGYYVPVDDERGQCAYRLWFLPRTGPVVALGTALAEGEFEFTVAFSLDDMDANGVSELALDRLRPFPTWFADVR